MADVTRIAFITGGAGGIGIAVAQRLAQAGMAIAIGDTDRDAIDVALGTLRAGGCDALGLVLDVTSESSVAAAYAAIDNRFNRLDVLVNCAGVQGLDNGKRPPVETMALGLWKQTLDVNLTGTFLSCRGAIPLMRRHKWGRMVNISSRAARMRTGLGNSNYAASKSGLIGFSRVLASEVGRDGITVNCIAPSRVITAMTLSANDSKASFEKNIVETAVGRLAEPEDVAGMVAFLCTDEASFVTGTIMDVNGGSYMP